MKPQHIVVVPEVYVKGRRIQVGTDVTAVLFSNRQVSGKVSAIYETTGGIQIRIVSGDLVHNIAATQVVGTKK